MPGVPIEVGVPFPGPGSVSKKYSALFTIWANAVVIDKIISTAIKSLFI
jgi:hypothetical protein